VAIGHLLATYPSCWPPIRRDSVRRVAIWSHKMALRYRRAAAERDTALELCPAAASRRGSLDSVRGLEPAARGAIA